MLSEEEAMEILASVENENLRKHMMAVAAIMERMAEKFGEDRVVWKFAGLLHDIDYGKVGHEEHGLKSAEMLQGKLPDYALHAIRAHNEMTGFMPESRMDFALRASDAASGLIVAAALVMPNKKLKEVRLETLKNKFKDKSFARRVDRGRIMECEKIGMELDEFLLLALEAMKGIAEKIGL